METRLTDLNSNNNDRTLLPGGELQSQSSSSSSPNEISKDTWGILSPCWQRQLDECCLIKNEYTAGRFQHLDIQFNEKNTDSKRLLQTSKTQFIIKRERVTNYKTADYEGDFVVFIYDKSMNGTYINKKKLKNNKGILLHNDTISIASPNYKVFEYLQSTNPVDIPSELAKNYVALRILGYGVCGPVTLIYSKTDYCPLAFKYIRKNGLDETAYQEIFMNEVDMLKGLKHPNVIQMVHAINTPSYIFVMLEYMQGGKLLDRIIKHDGLSENLTKFYFYQIVTAVEYLHDKGIIHRDLKPENILLLDNDEYTLVKLTDLAFSKLIDCEATIKKFDGMSYYDAPEIFRSERRQQYTSQVDVWSLGVILYRMLSNRLPFTKENKSF
ncbi:ovarian-specific serine/threonine-protein kinase Lok-like [Aphidius gifuensis]|uniref:ovarian-specific serine/threonine-protein kinase Lok-like n=1 Tax=Aphidius gifuensis TaxID=684658 RepID=UPI001CDC5CA3|nr:ovarian-specific serine/threonine-protein kinase Lok-like [Aphidius gifuensis]